MKETLKHATNALYGNIYVVVLFFLSIFLICREAFFGGMFTVGMAFIAMYWFHYLSHLHISFPLNSVHVYHHRNSNMLSHVSQIILEFVAGCGAIAYILLHNRYFSRKISGIHIGCIFFLWFFYTTVHNVNYSMFHVNHVHEYHHAHHMYNLGPDICDILFGTKHNVEEEYENISHYIPNLIAGLLLAIGFQQGLQKSVLWELCFLSVYFFACMLLLLFTVVFVFEHPYMKEIYMAVYKDDFHASEEKRRLFALTHSEWIREIEACISLLKN